MHALLSHWAIILGTMIVTLAGVLVAMNLGTPGKRIQRRVARLYAADSPMFRRSMGVLLGPAILPGNRMDTLLNGDEIFPAMLTAIRAARKTITFETFIYWSGGIGEQFAEALAERANSGGEGARAPRLVGMR
jgi:cardiolipin synthase